MRLVCRVASWFAKDFCKSAAMSSNSQRFASLVIAAFDDRALTTDELVKQAGGPSNTYMTSLRKAADGKADMTEPRSDTYRRIEVAGNWKKGTARLVWRGADPVVIPKYEPVSEWSTPESLPPRRRFSTGLEGYAERIADRLMDLEERVDLLEQQLHERLGGDGNVDADHAGDPAPTTEPGSGSDLDVKFSEAATHSALVQPEETHTPPDDAARS